MTSIAIAARAEPTVQAAPNRRSGNTALRRFRRDRLAVAALLLLLVVVVLAIAAPLVAGDPAKVDLDAIKRAPSAQHILGTDSAGRDVWSRVVYGGRVSMSVGVAAVAIATLIG